MLLRLREAQNLWTARTGAVITKAGRPPVLVAPAADGNSAPDSSLMKKAQEAGFMGAVEKCDKVQQLLDGRKCVDHYDEVGPGR